MIKCYPLVLVIYRFSSHINDHRLIFVYTFSRAQWITPYLYLIFVAYCLGHNAITLSEGNNIIRAHNELSRFRSYIPRS